MCEKAGNTESPEQLHRRQTFIILRNASVKGPWLAAWVVTQAVVVMTAAAAKLEQVEWPTMQ